MQRGCSPPKVSESILMSWANAAGAAASKVAAATTSMERGGTAITLRVGVKGVRSVRPPALLLLLARLGRVRLRRRGLGGHLGILDRDGGRRLALGPGRGRGR